jgi:Fe-S-cluster containining protein
VAAPQLLALWQKIAGFWARVDERAPGALTCHAGCSDCCLDGLSVTRTEAAALEELLGGLDDERRGALREAALRESESCPALIEGRCAIYAARPVVCRSHGLAIRIGPDADAKRHLPIVDACPLNFVGQDLEALPSELVLEQATLSTLVAAVDAASRGAGVEAKRVPLRELLATE